MKNTGMNFRHLYYFWVVAKEGGITQAAARLGLAIQTISTQLAQLEQSIGKALFMQQGRKLARDLRQNTMMAPGCGTGQGTPSLAQLRAPSGLIGKGSAGNCAPTQCATNSPHHGISSLA